MAHWILSWSSDLACVQGCVLLWWKHILASRQWESLCRSIKVIYNTFVEVYNLIYNAESAIICEYVKLYIVNVRPDHFYLFLVFCLQRFNGVFILGHSSTSFQIKSFNKWSALSTALGINTWLLPPVTPRTKSNVIALWKQTM